MVKYINVYSENERAWVRRRRGWIKMFPYIRWMEI